MNDIFLNLAGIYLLIFSPILIPLFSFAVGAIRDVVVQRKDDH